MAKAPEHIPRLLALVRALVRARELPLARLCEELGIDERELRGDIELLSLCGLPPYGPDSLIDIQVVRDRVRLSNKVLAPPPLQLSDEEAAGLRVALRLAEAQGWPERRVPELWDGRAAERIAAHLATWLARRCAPAAT